MKINLFNTTRRIPRRDVVVLLILFFPLLLGVALLSPNLGEQFFLDSTLVSEIMQVLEENSLEDILSNPVYDYSNSFIYIAFIFKIIGLSNVNNTIQVSVLFSISFLILISSIDLKKVSLRSFAYFSYAIVPFTVYQSQFSKEIFITGLSFLFILMNRKKIFLHKIVFFSYLAFVILVLRNYWLLTCLMYLYFYAFKNINTSVKIGSIILILPILYFLLFGSYITDFRSKLNEGLSAVDKNSIINNLFINSSIIGDILNYAMGFLRIMFPILFLNFSKPYIILICFFISIININVIYSIFNINRISIEKKKSLFLILSFILTQALFESDIGSMIKHLTGVSIFYIILLSKN